MTDMHNDAFGFQQVRNLGAGGVGATNHLALRLVVLRQSRGADPAYSYYMYVLSFGIHMVLSLLN